MSETPSPSESEISDFDFVGETEQREIEEERKRDVPVPQFKQPGPTLTVVEIVQTVVQAYGSYFLQKAADVIVDYGRKL